MVDVCAVREKMAEHGFTHVSDLMRASGVSRPTIKKVLSGITPSAGVVSKLSVALDLNGGEIDTVFFREEPQGAFLGCCNSYCAQFAPTGVLEHPADTKPL